MRTLVAALVALTTALTGSTALAGPDLVVTDISLSPSFAKVGTGTITATIANIGDEGTGFLVNINILMYLDGVECDDGLIIAGLGAGSTATEETTACVPSTPGPHEITFVVDTDSDVAEDDESNNTLSATFEWWWPDLKVTDIVVDPVTPKAGSNGTLIATIENDSPVDVGCDLFNSINVEMYLDGEYCDDGLIICGLGAYEVATEETSSCIPDTPGPHSVTFVVDTADDVDELDEDNNSLTTEIIWYWPDLTVTDIALDPPTPGPGENVQFTATIENVGFVDAACDLLDAINVAFYLDGSAEPCDDGLIICGLSALSTATEQVTGCDPQGAGPHTITAVVDVDEDVPEEDETNNALTVEFVVCGDTELCNGLDDDCNGLTDEAFQTLGDPCDGDDADTCENGVLVCAEDGSGVVCEEAGGASEELCDGLDNDCDGETDEDFPTKGDPCSATEGECEIAGVLGCNAAGDGVECMVTVGEEVCDGADNDCNGLTDEGWPALGAPCTVGEGACVAVGAWVCDDDGVNVACDATPEEAQPELCDTGIDEDCDGATDEGCACGVGDTQACGTNEGACSAGSQECVLGAGAFSDECVGGTGPSPEECDGQDNDCDGSTDEDCECDSGDSQSCQGPGVCGAGTQACIGGKWAPCVGEDAPGEEICDDDEDNDCDGLVDEGCVGCDPGKEQPCPDPPDACAAYLTTCLADGTWGECEPVPGTEDPDCNQPDAAPDEGPGEDTGPNVPDEPTPEAPGPGEDTGPAPDTAGPGEDTGGGGGGGGGGEDSGTTFDVGSQPSSASGDDGCASGGAGSTPPALVLVLVLGWVLRRFLTCPVTRARGG